MVAPQEEKVAGVLDFVRHKETDCLEGELAAVNIVSQEEIIGLRGVLSVIEEAQEVGVLAVDIAWVGEGVPHILRGASSSRKMGCCMKISLHLWQSPLI